MSRSIEEMIEVASFRKKGKNWYYRFSDSDGRQRERKGCTDRRETEAMAGLPKRK
jgi:hypothetical protein